MTDISYINWISLNDKAIQKQIGKFIKHHRLELNLSQESLASKAGISRSTLSILERGQTVTLTTLIQVLRVLDKLDILRNFEIKQIISPLALAKFEKAKRKRASRKQAN